MMNFDEFVDVVKEMVLDYIPEDHKGDYEGAEVRVSDELRINRTVKKLLIRKKSSGSMNAAPSFTLEDEYDTFRCRYTGSFVSYIKDFAERYIMADNVKPDLSGRSEDENPLDINRTNVFFSLINKEKNTDLLKDIPHRDFLDLAIIYNILVSRSSCDDVIALVTNEMMEKAGMTERELYELAETNTPLLYRYTKKDILDVMSDAAGMRKEDLFDMDEVMFYDFYPSYVISTMSHRNGASVILYPGVMEKIAEKMGSFFIFPSSRGEVIVSKADFDEEIRQKHLRTIVEVNKSLPLEDFLADSLYLYDTETKELEIAATA